MFIFPACYSGSSGGAFLDSVISSVCCDLDATISDSYGGSGQTWANLIASPADGAAQTDYDFFRGADGSATTDDPTFTGVAGDKAAYFALDGGDFFRKAAANTALINDLHKTTGGSEWWIAAAFRYGGTGFGTVFSNMGPGFTQGIEVLAGDFSNGIRVNVARTSFASNDFETGALVDGTDYLVIATGDPSSTDDLRVWLNTTTKIADTDMSTGTSTTNANEVAAFAGRSDNGLNFNNGSRFYHVSIGNAFIDDSDAALIFSHLEARHNRDYTP